MEQERYHHSTTAHHGYHVCTYGLINRAAKAIEFHQHSLSASSTPSPHLENPPSETSIYPTACFFSRHNRTHPHPRPHTWATEPLVPDPPRGRRLQIPPSTRRCERNQSKWVDEGPSGSLFSTLCTGVFCGTVACAVFPHCICVALCHCCICPALCHCCPRCLPVKILAQHQDTTELSPPASVRCGTFNSKRPHRTRTHRWMVGLCCG